MDCLIGRAPAFRVELEDFREFLLSPSSGVDSLTAVHILQAADTNATRYLTLFSNVAAARTIALFAQDVRSPNSVLGGPTAPNCILPSHLKHKLSNRDPAFPVALPGAPKDPANPTPPEPFPLSLVLATDVRIVPCPFTVTGAAGGGGTPRPIIPLRAIGAQQIGRMVTIQGISTFASDVNARFEVASYLCRTCGAENYQPVTNMQFAPVTQCQSKSCQGALSEQQRPIADAGPSARPNPPALRSDMDLYVPNSKMSDFQTIRLQEVASETPEGHVPRSITVHLRGSLVRAVTPGDVVTIHGIYTPLPAAGSRMLQLGFSTEAVVIAQEIVLQRGRGAAGTGKARADAALHTRATQHLADAVGTDAAMDGGDAVVADLRDSPEAIFESAAAAENLSAPERRLLDDFRRLSDDEKYEVLSRSIAPEIWGHEDVKKAIILQLAGGVAKKQEDAVRTRGDINVLLVGDPGCGKSQLLRFVSQSAPRAVYATGKGSSGVGLTAAVVRNSQTREFHLEGGALVQADRGVCCIDEWDKMAESDRTSLYEVMEQGTVSIAKGGIMTSLNARAAILAAANPAWGRYNPTKTPAENINLPPALLSRFDLLFVIRDVVSPEKDRQLASHITSVHMRAKERSGESGPAGEAKDALLAVSGRGAGAAAAGTDDSAVPPITAAAAGPMILNARMLRTYLAEAKAHAPFVPDDAVQTAVSAYVMMRRDEREEEQRTGDLAGSYTCLRTLMSLLRLAQARARLALRDQVALDDVREAIRLMSAARATTLARGASFSLAAGATVGAGAAVGAAPRASRIDRAFASIQRLLRGCPDNTATKGQVYAVCPSVPTHVVEETLAQYSDLGVFAVTDDTVRLLGQHDGNVAE
jgi:DNA replicative helicase MCM subunit Mcm2 (Cdc46/Mcm family)